MNFSNFIKSEFSRLFENIAFKMEAEKLFIEGIKEDKFFYIDNFEDGISCNLFNKDLGIDMNINIFNSNVNNLLGKMKLFNLSVILQKNLNKYNLLFLVKRPVEKEINKNTSISVESLISDSVNLINKFGNMFGGILYKIEYSEMSGGRIYSEKELDEIIKRDKKRKKKMNKINKKMKSNKLSKDNLNKMISNRCENFENMYKNENILIINVYDILELNLIQNIFHVYYLILFNYILPNIYINFKNVNKIEKIDIDFSSLINKNKVLKDSLDTIFFITKNENQYNNIINVNDYLDQIPYQLDDIEIVLY